MGHFGQQANPSEFNREKYMYASCTLNLMWESPSFISGKQFYQQDELLCVEENFEHSRNPTILCLLSLPILMQHTSSQKRNTEHLSTVFLTIYLSLAVYAIFLSIWCKEYFLCFHIFPHSWFWPKFALSTLWFYVTQILAKSIVISDLIKINPSCIYFYSYFS